MEQHKDILLVNPNYWSDVFGENTHLPCGLGFIARVLELNGNTYDIIDLNFQQIGEIFNLLNRHKPPYLGISMMSYRVEQSYELLNRVKATFPDITIIVGGPHVIASKQNLLTECPAVDIACIGEGEETIIEILNGKQMLANIQGIYYRATTGVEMTAPRPFTKKLDHIPFPTYNGFQLDKYQNKMLLASSRGCPYKCTFCGAPTFLGKKWRRRSAQGMVEELLYWYERGYREFVFEDSLFSADKKRIHNFCDQMIELNIPISIDVEGARADHMNYELLKHMKQAKFQTLVFGVESANNHVLQAYKKGETIEQIENTVKIANQLGFQIGMFFIIGGPGETVQDVEHSFELAQKYENVAFAYFFKLTPVPGTPYFEYAVEAGYVNEAKKYPTGNFGFEGVAFIGNNAMTAEEMTRMLKKARKIEKLVRNRFDIRKYIKAIFGIKTLPRWLVSFAAHVLLNPIFYSFSRQVMLKLRSRLQKATV